MRIEKIIIDGALLVAVSSFSCSDRAIGFKTYSKRTGKHAGRPGSQGARWSQFVAPLALFFVVRLCS
jgi:hypothetical protein